MCENGNCIEMVLKLVMQLAWCFSILRTVLCALHYSLGGYVFLTSFHAIFLACLLFFPLLTSLATAPAIFQVLCFLSISCLSSTQPIMSSAVSDLNTGCRAVTSSCTSLLTLLCFTVTATHLHPSGCQHSYHYTNMLPLGSCLACSSWTHYTLQWRQHDHLKCQEPSISECSATYTRFESSQFILFYDFMSLYCMLQEERFHDLTNMSDELVRENYHGKDRVTQRKEEVLQCWQELLHLLDKHKTNLTMLCGLMAMLREVDTVMATIAELQVGTSKLLWTYRLLRETFTSAYLQ